MISAKEIVFKLYDFEFGGDIKEITPCENVYVKYDGKNAEVGGKTVPELMRAYTLLVKGVKDGKNEFTINESPCFDTCGVMLDASRNAVMKVEKVKEYMEYMASLGMNYLMLYTEDTYEVPEYPRMGYMRGRYSIAELKEIDGYAKSLGIEVVPCIQTLGHMWQFLQWNENAEISDTPDILLAGEEKTYDFIEACVRAMRSAFGTKKIHIGCDEAHTLGRGKYMDKHGFCNRFDILNNHLAKVVEICEKYDFKPLIWSDMYFRLRSKTGDYYDKEFSSADEIKGSIPDIELVFWDYYHTDASEYARLFDEHLKLEKDVSFAGAIWTWCGHLASPEFTMTTQIPALREAVKKGIKAVTATMWGDDGNECNHFQTIHLLPVFSEFCYKGETCTEEDIRDMSEFVSGTPWDVTYALSTFTEHVKGTYTRHFLGKNILYANIFYNLISSETPLNEIKIKFDEAYNIFKNDKTFKFSEYAALLYKVCSAKLDVMANIRENYKDKEYSLNLINNVLPAIKEDVRKVSEMHKKMWHETYKPFGFEVLNGRYGWVMSNLDLAIYRLTEYVEGRIDAIEELDAELLHGKRGTGNTFKVFTTACY